MSHHPIVISDEEFNALEEYTPAYLIHKHRWDAVDTALRAGKNVMLHFTTRAERKSLRLGLGLMAAKRGLVLDIRYGDSFLAARLRDTPPWGEMTPLSSPHRSTRRLRSIRVDRVDHRSP